MACQSKTCREIGIVHLNGVDWGGVKADSEGVSAFFTWGGSAIVDGRPMQIGVATQDIEEGSSKVSFAYPRGQESNTTRSWGLIS